MPLFYPTPRQPSTLPPELLQIPPKLRNLRWTPAGESAPVNVGLPRIVGPSTTGTTLAATTGAWRGTRPFAYGYEWQRCDMEGRNCATIGGATSASYAPTSEDLGSTLRVSVSATNALGSATSTSEPTAPIAIGMVQTAQLRGSGWEPGQFDHPSDVAVDAAGDVLVLDQGNDRVEEFGPEGAYIREFGSEGEGVLDFDGPRSIVVSAGEIWIADTDASRVQEFSETGEFVANFTVGFRPEGLAVDGNGDVWLLDRETTGTGGEKARLEVYSQAGHYLKAVGAAGSGAGEVTEPTDIAYDGHSDIWVTNVHGQQDRVIEFNESGELIREWEPKDEEGDSLDAYSIAIDQHGDVWVGDGASSLNEFSESGEYLSTIESASAPATYAQFAFASGVAPTAAGGVWVTEPEQDSVTRWAPDIANPPANIDPPSLTGQLQQYQTLTADHGKWSEEPTSYSYQWQRCDAAGASCADIAGATGPTYVPREADPGLTVRVLVTATNPAGSATSVSAASAPARYAPPEPECSDHWIGPETGSWNQPGNWSTGALPGIRDTACAPSGSAITLSEGTVEIAALRDAGALQLVGGALALTGNSGESSVATLTLEHATLTGSETLTISSALTWSGGVMSGTGTTVIGPQATAVLHTRSYYYGSGEALALITRRLVNEGTVRIEGANSEPLPRGVALEMSEGARLENEGTFTDNSTDGPIETGWGARGVAPAFVNAGHFLRTIYQQGQVTVPFSNQGEVELTDGGLFVEGGGIAGEVAGGSWYSQNREGQEIIFRPRESLAPAPILIRSGVSLEHGVSWYIAPVRIPRGGPSAESANPPTLIGEPLVGKPQTVSVGTWTGEEPIHYSYQWQNCNDLGGECANIEGASEPTYTPTQTTDGATLRVLVTGTSELASVTAPSRPSVVIGPPEAPTNTNTPAIAGGTTAGQTLSATPGKWTASQPLTYTYQWQSCSPSGGECADIEGATEASYTLSTTDAGSTLRVIVTATNDAGQASARSGETGVIATAQPPANETAPVVSGHLNDGQSLIARAGTWRGSAPTSYGYQWESCSEHGSECAPIEDATAPEYELGDGDIGTTVRVAITAKNAGGRSEAVSAATTVVEPELPSEQEPPSISGTPDANEVLVANPGVWSGSRQQLSYQWESCSEHGGECAPIEGATEPEYQLGSGDVDSTVRVRVGLHTLAGSLSDVSAATPVIGAAETLANTALPQAESSPQEGAVVQASTGAWAYGATNLTYTFQWQRCQALGGNCANIEGATGQTYSPGAADVGDALRVRVSAADQHESSTVISEPTQPVSAPSVPALEQPPAIEGTPLEGETLTVSEGSWKAEGPIAYSFQWERCNAEADCMSIDGATEPSYTLTSGDADTRIAVVVTARGRDGIATAASRPTMIIQPESLMQLSPPSTTGIVEAGATLTAAPGIWTGQGSISFAYQWESCGSEGSNCAPIDDADEEGYVLAASERGSSLRAQLSITSSHGSQTVYTPHTIGAPGGEVTPSEAQEVAQQTDPAILAPASSVELEEQTLAPKLSDGSEQLTAESTLTGATVSKENPGEFAVNTPVGELSLTPAETLSGATSDPTIVNETAALFANTWPATDTILRAEPLGATALLQVRSAEAPKSFSWNVRLGPNETLRKLPNGAIGVINTSERPEPAPSPEPSGAPPSAEGAPETPEEEAEAKAEEQHASEVEAKGEQETEVPLEALPPAPTATTPSAETKTGLPEPEDSQAEATEAASAIGYSEAHTDGQTLMVIRAPTATDSQGQPVPAGLTTTGTTVTLTVAPGTDAKYPLVAQLAIDGLPNKVSEERDPVHYGLADDTVQAFSPFDRNLEKGPMKVRKARLRIPYDVLLPKVKAREAGAQREREAQNKEPEETAYELLTHWVAAVRREGLVETLITLGPDEHCNSKECELPSREYYRAAFKDLMQWAYARSIRTFGAWNEPEPDGIHAPRAAHYWQVAQYVIRHNHCAGCTVVAGEFAFEKYEKRYIEEYRNTLHDKHHLCFHCSSESPTVWGFHDYHDIVHRTHGAYLSSFAAFMGGRTGKGQIWITETDVELQNGHEATELSVEKTNNEAEAEERQRKAANEILELHGHSEGRLDRVYYYDYRQPSEKRRESTGKLHEFDGGLVEALPEKGRFHNDGQRRPAYCILAECAVAG